MFRIYEWTFSSTCGTRRGRAADHHDPVSRVYLKIHHQPVPRSKQPRF